MSDIPLPPPFDHKSIYAEAAKATLHKIYNPDLAQLVKALFEDMAADIDHTKSAIMLANFMLSEGYTSNHESSPMPNTDAMGREKFWEDLGRPND